VTAARQYGFCMACGGELDKRFVENEGRDRLVCVACGEIHYVNPKIVAGTIPVAPDGRIWLLRRGIEPRIGSWTFPAGFMEMGETVEEAAARETMEELNLPVRIDRLLGVYARSTAATVHIVYVAEALGDPSIGHETLSFQGFVPKDIPWAELAFWSTRQALRDWVRIRGIS